MAAKVIVFGNEKGGVGKSTLCIHTTTFLLQIGYRVALIDLDLYQKSSSNFFSIRLKTAERYNCKLSHPHIIDLGENPKEESLINTIIKESENYDILIIDTPGSHNPMNSIAHSYGDYIITPVNPSYIDLSLLGSSDKEMPGRVIPGVYSAMFFEQRMKRLSRDRKKIEWIVILNSLPATKNIRNSIQVKLELNNFAKKLGFRLGSGLHDRVIYKELYALGLTLLDRHDLLIKKINALKMSPALLVARQEIISMLKSLQIGEVTAKIEEM